MTELTKSPNKPWLPHEGLDAEHARVLDRIRAWLGDGRARPRRLSHYEMRTFVHHVVEVDDEIPEGETA